MESPCITLVLLSLYFISWFFGGRNNYLSFPRSPCNGDHILYSSTQTQMSSRNVDKYPHNMIKLVTDVDKKFKVQLSGTKPAIRRELFMGSQPVDRVRNQQLPKVGPTLDYLGEPCISLNAYFYA